MIKSDTLVLFVRLFFVFFVFIFTYGENWVEKSEGLAFKSEALKCLRSVSAMTDDRRTDAGKKKQNKGLNSVVIQ